MHSVAHRMAPVRTTHAHAHRGPPAPWPGVRCMHRILGARASRGADPVAGCRSSSPDPWTDGSRRRMPRIFPRPLDRWSGVLWMETILPVRRHGHRGSVQQTCEPAAVGRPSLAMLAWSRRVSLAGGNFASQHCRGGARRHPPPLTESAQGVMRIPASHLQTGKIVSINRPAVSLRSTGHQRFGPGRSSLRMALAGGRHVHQ